MIVEALIGVVLAFVVPMLDALPAPDYASVWDGLLSGASQVGAYAMSLNGFLPVSELMGALSALMLLLPLVAAYKVFSWVWRHVPTIAGFGTGNG